MVWPGLLSVFPILVVTVSHNITVEVCDCVGSSYVGALRFVDKSCETPPTPRAANPVRYSLYTNHPETQQVQGVVCSRWKNIRRTTTTFFNSVIEVREHLPIDTSADQCTVMKLRRTCETVPMDFNDNKWSYTKETHSTHVWWDTVSTVDVHCLLEEITLLLVDDGTVLSTPIGKIDPSRGSYSHNHVTVLWDKQVVKSNPDKRFLLETGDGDLIQENDLFTPSR